MLFRIGNKVVSLHKINTAIEGILEARSQGKSQQEVAKEVGVDRTFISRLESLGEIRQGQRVALIGFPIKNKSEIQKIAEEYGVDYIFLMNDRERKAFFLDKSGIPLLDEIMYLIGKAREHDTVILMGSDVRIKLAKALLDEQELIPLVIGTSPIREDKYISPALLRDLLEKVTQTN